MSIRAHLPWIKKVKAAIKSHELYGTYIVVTKEHTSTELLAIQDWARTHPDLTFLDMPYADVMSVAERAGKAYVCIDEKGNVTASIHPRRTWRKLTPVLGLAVKDYKVAPQTTMVNGKEYDSKELEEALSALSPVEKL